MAEQTAPLAMRSAPSAIALAGLAALAVAMGVGRFAFTPVLPLMLMQEDIGLTVAAGGWLAAANYAGYFAGALWAALTPVRAALAIRAGLLAIGVTTLGMSLDIGIAGWAILRFSAGIASAWVLVHVSAWCLERLAPVRRPLLEGVVFAGVGVGIAAAGILCAVLAARHAGSVAAWRELGLFSFAVTAVVWNAFGPVAPESATGRPALRVSGAQMRLAFAYGMFGFGYIIPATFLPILAKELLHGSPEFGWAWPVFGAAAAVSTVLMKSVRCIPSRALWFAAQLVMAFGVVAPIVWPGMASIVLAALCVGGTFMVVTMAGMLEARRIAPAQASGLMAMMTAAFAAGQIAGPVLTSVLPGFSVALPIASAALVVGACVLWVPGD